jgi:hypothetical protein
VWIEWRPNPITNPGALGEAQVLFDDTEIVHDGTDDEPVYYDNPGFELWGNTDNQPVPYWGGGFGPARKVSNVNVIAKQGPAYLRLSSFAATTQRVNILTAPGIDLAKLAAGEYDAELKGWFGTEEWGFEGFVSIAAYDFDGIIFPHDDPIAIASSDWFEIRPERTWQKFDPLRITLPPDTVQVYIQLDGRPGPRQTIAGQKVIVDALSLVAYEHDAAGTFDSYGNVEFEAQNAGITDGNPPVFDTDIGQTTVDGTVTWEAVPPKYSFFSDVTGVTDHATYQLNNVDAEDNWFEFGIIEFLDGPNEKRRMEVKSWNNTTKILVLALPMPVPAEVGDSFKLVAGCDKSREMCVAKFDNILNFRGFPNVPGTDEYFKIGGT